MPTDESVKKMTKVLGLTGGIASGKSTVSEYFKTFEIPIIDADKVAHDVMRAGQPVVRDIAETFGEEIILPNGEIDRKKLGQIVFKDSDKRKQLDNLVRAEIRDEIDRRIKVLMNEKKPLIILDIPLLFEAGYEKMVDEVMVVYVDTATQKERLLKRNTDLTSEDATNRIQSQMPLKDKAKKADVVIDNQGTIDATRKQVEKWLKEYYPSIHANA